MKKQTTYKIYKTAMIIILTAFITFIITSIGMYKYIEGDGKISALVDSTSNDIAVNLAKYKEILNKYYLGDIDEEKLAEGSIKGYIEGLDDPYTEYISKEEMKDYMEDTLGNYVGIGIYMTADKKQDKVKVISPIKGSPAEKAGIEPGDIIVSVNGKTYKASEMSAMSNDIKGEEGTEVEITILRGTETKEFKVKREKIKVNPVEGKVLDNNIGYIKFTSFDETTADDFKNKYEELKKSNIKSLIIDLRNNGGGLVDQALKIADYITEKDSVLLYEVDKNGKEEVKKSENDPIISEPIIILTNENTASASEILAGALKDLGKATIVGTKTYGKGVIQQILTVKDGSGIKLTVEEYQTPNRNKINKIGIEPNETVELPSDVESVLNVPEDKDTQLQKAQEIANKLTIFRMILVPIMVIIPFLGIENEILGIPLTYVIIDIIFIIASITDKLDGYIARSRNQVTTFGKFLDPIADKILVLAAMVMLVEFGKIPAWIPIIVLAREFIVSGYRLVAIEKGGKVIAASKWGKLKTVTQMIAIILAFLDLYPFGECFKGYLQGSDFILNLTVTIMMIIQTIATVFSGIEYLKNGKELLK